MLIADTERKLQTDSNEGKLEERSRHKFQEYGMQKKNNITCKLKKQNQTNKIK